MNKAPNHENIVMRNRHEEEARHFRGRTLPSSTHHRTPTRKQPLVKERRRHQNLDPLWRTAGSNLIFQNLNLWRKESPISRTGPKPPRAAEAPTFHNQHTGVHPHSRACQNQQTHREEQTGYPQCENTKKPNEVQLDVCGEKH